MKKVILSAALVSALLTARAQVFTETFGKVSANTKIADHVSAKGFSNSGKLTFSGNAELQQQGSSDGTYPGASGGANLRFANVAGTHLIVSGINTSSIEMPVIGFGILKGPNSSNGSEMAVEYSIDGGKTWTGTKFKPLRTGEGTGLVWNYRETATIPKADNLSIRFRQTGDFVVFRIDDVAIVAKDK
jgi:hypothetical protein